MECEVKLFKEFWPSYILHLEIVPGHLGDDTFDTIRLYTITCYKVWFTPEARDRGYHTSSIIDRSEKLLKLLLSVY